MSGQIRRVVHLSNLERLGRVPLGLLLALVRAEVAVRVLRLTPPPQPPGVLAPGGSGAVFPAPTDVVYSGWNLTLAFDFGQRTNSRGYHGQERPLDKAASAFRIVAIGDSYTWGYSIRAAATWIHASSVPAPLRSATISTSSAPARSTSSASWAG